MTPRDQIILEIAKVIDANPFECGCPGCDDRINIALNDAGKVFDMLREKYNFELALQKEGPGRMLAKCGICGETKFPCACVKEIGSIRMEPEE